MLGISDTIERQEWVLDTAGLLVIPKIISNFTKKKRNLLTKLFSFSVFLIVLLAMITSNAFRLCLGDAFFPGNSMQAFSPLHISTVKHLTSGPDLKG